MPSSQVLPTLVILSLPDELPGETLVLHAGPREFMATNECLIVTHISHQWRQAGLHTRHAWTNNMLQSDLECVNTRMLLGKPYLPVEVPNTIHAQLHPLEVLEIELPDISSDTCPGDRICTAPRATDEINAPMFGKLVATDDKTTQDHKYINELPIFPDPNVSLSCLWSLSINFRSFELVVSLVRRTVTDLTLSNLWKGLPLQDMLSLLRDLPALMNLVLANVLSPSYRPTGCFEDWPLASLPVDQRVALPHLKRLSTSGEWCGDDAATLVYFLVIPLDADIAITGYNTDAHANGVSIDTFKYMLQVFQQKERGCCGVMRAAPKLTDADGRTCVLSFEEEHHNISVSFEHSTGPRRLSMDLAACNPNEFIRALLESSFSLSGVEAMQFDVPQIEESTWKAILTKLGSQLKHLVVEGDSSSGSFLDALEMLKDGEDDDNEVQHGNDNYVQHSLPNLERLCLS